MYNHVHVVLSFESVDKILWCDVSNAPPQVLLLRGAILFFSILHVEIIFVE